MVSVVGLAIADGLAVNVVAIKTRNFTVVSFVPKSDDVQCVVDRMPAGVLL